MITHWQSGETIVGRLRIEGAGVDPTIAQLRLSSLLNNAIFHPSALPPAAIVFIRKLGDPLPRSLQIQQRDIRPPPAWQQALSAKLDRLVVSAARPALGSVPANAEAVVFLDRSELLASLAADWCEGRVAARWWWQSFLGQGTASQITKELWRSAPEYVPAALDQLAKAAKATTFVKTFSDAEARALLISVARSFSLNDLVPVLETVSDPDRLSFPAKRKENLTLPAPFTERDVRSTADISRGAPWDHWVRQSETSGLGPVQQSLLGVALMLQRAAAKVRATSFAREVETWQSETIFAQAMPYRFLGDKKKDESGRQRLSRPRASAARVPDNSTAPLNPEADSPEESSPDSTRISFSGSAAARADTTGAQALPPNPIIDGLTGAQALPPNPIIDGLTGALTSQEQQTPSQRQLPPSLERKSLTTPRVEHGGPGGDLKNSAITMEPATDAPDQFPLIESQTATQFGGLFYLINLGIYLGLYGDFTTPAEPGIELNIWDFVALVGRELVGERIQADPLWTLLARLSGRAEGEEPGSGFKPKDEWRLPAEWLGPFAKESLGRWWAGQGRLRLFHSGGFLMLDVPLAAGDPAEQLQREMKPYKSLEFQVSSFEFSEDAAVDEEPQTRKSVVETSSEVRAWLDRLMPYVRVRLQRALGLNETEDPAPILCEQQGRVSLTATHVDLFFALDASPIEIRFAGLDRNPGWVPAAGRFIAFHFE